METTAQKVPSVPCPRCGGSLTWTAYGQWWCQQEGKYYPPAWQVPSVPYSPWNDWGAWILVIFVVVLIFFVCF